MIIPPMEMIEKTQYRAALAITGTWRGTSYNKICEELGWESLSDRKWSRRFFQFYKICIYRVVCLVNEDCCMGIQILTLTMIYTAALLVI